MSFFEALNGGLDAYFKELSKSKRMEEKRREQQFEELTSTPLLFSSDHLSQLAEGANKNECDTLLDYLYRFNNHVTDVTEDGEINYLNILDIDSYKSIEKDIIDKRWR